MEDFMGIRLWHFADFAAEGVLNAVLSLLEEQEQKDENSQKSRYIAWAIIRIE